MDKCMTATASRVRQVPPGQDLTSDGKELPATVDGLVTTIHERLVNLDILLSDIHSRLVGPEPGSPSCGDEKLSLLRLLERCEQLTHSLTCRANDISARIG